MAMVAPVKKANTKAVKIKSLRIAFPLRCLGTVKVTASMCSASDNPILMPCCFLAASALGSACA